MSKITIEMYTQAVGREPEMDDLDRCNCPYAGHMGHEQCGWNTKQNKPNFLVPYHDVIKERAQAEPKRTEWDVKQTDKDTFTLTPKPPVWIPKHGLSIIIGTRSFMVTRENKVIHENGTITGAIKWAKDEEARIDFENAKPTGYVAVKHATYNFWKVVAPDGSILVTVGDQNSADKILKHLNR